MKRVFLFSGIALLVISIVLGASFWKFYSYVANVQRVHQEHCRAQDAAMEVKRPPDWMGLNLAFTNRNKSVLIAKLNKIDTAGCPQNFRLAFRDFLDALERSENVGLFVALKTLVDAGVATKGEFRPLSGDLDRLDHDEKVTEAFQRLRREALKWGVDY